MTNANIQNDTEEAARYHMITRTADDPESNADNWFTEQEFINQYPQLHSLLIGATELELTGDGWHWKITVL